MTKQLLSRSAVEALKGNAAVDYASIFYVRLTDTFKQEYVTRRLAGETAEAIFASHGLELMGASRMKSADYRFKKNVASTTLVEDKVEEAFVETENKTNKWEAIRTDMNKAREYSKLIIQKIVANHPNSESYLEIYKYINNITTKRELNTHMWTLVHAMKKEQEMNTDPVAVILGGKVKAKKEEKPRMTAKEYYWKALLESPVATVEIKPDPADRLCTTELFSEYMIMNSGEPTTELETASEWFRGKAKHKGDFMKGTDFPVEVSIWKDCSGCPFASACPNTKNTKLSDNCPSKRKKDTLAAGGDFVVKYDANTTDLYKFGIYKDNEKLGVLTKSYFNSHTESFLALSDDEIGISIDIKNARPGYIFAKGVAAFTELEKPAEKKLPTAREFTQAEIEQSKIEQDRAIALLTAMNGGSV